MSGDHLHQAQTLKEIEDPISHEEAEIRALELELKEMAQRILEYRRTLPDRLMKVLESCLSAKRPFLPQIDAVEAGISPEAEADSGLLPPESSGATQPELDPKANEKILLLKEKISKNLSTMPIVLKRLHECIARIDKLEEYNLDIHEAFKKTRTH